MVDEADRQAALRVLESLGVTPEALLGQVQLTSRSTPTFGDYIPLLLATMPAGATRNHYKSYWTKLLAQPGWPERRIDEPTFSDFDALLFKIKASRRISANSRDGSAVVAHTVSALRYLYKRAVNDRLIPPDRNLAARIPKPRQQPSNRRALSNDLLSTIIDIADRTGNDPDLDTLVLRLHIETACRRAGAVALQRPDLDPVDCIIRLREKGGTDFWQPISPTLMAGLIRHHEGRSGKQTEAVLRYRNGKPMGYGRYDYLIARIRTHVPQAAIHNISIHWIRHTTLTYVERNFGPAVTRAFARHSENSGTVTDIYTKVTIEEIADVVASLTGEPHPLALHNNHAP